MDGISFTVIGKHKNVFATNGPVVPALLSRMSERVVDSNQPIEYPSSDSSSHAPFTQARSATTSSPQPKRLVSRIDHNKLFDRIAPLPAVGDKAKHSTPRISLPNVTLSDHVPSNNTPRKAKEETTLAAATPSRTLSQRKVGTQYRPSAGVKWRLESSSMKRHRSESLSSMELENSVSQFPMSTIYEQSVADSPSSNPFDRCAPISSLPKPSATVSPEKLTGILPISMSDCPSGDADVTPPSVEDLRLPLSSNNMDVDHVVNCTVGRVSAFNGDTIRGRTPISYTSGLPTLVPVASQFPSLQGADTSFTFSSPIKANDVTYDTLRFHMNALWKETEDQAREWAEVADAKRSGIMFSGDITDECQDSIIMQSKRGREDSVDDITGAEGRHLRKRQRTAVEPLGVSRTAPEPKTSEIADGAEPTGISIVKDEKSSTSDEVQDRHATSGQMHGVQLGNTISREMIQEAAEEDSEDDEDAEVAHVAAQKRAAEERERQAAEMRKNLEQELAIQRREREREEQERQRKKEELESTAQRLRENLWQRKGAKSISTTPAVGKMQEPLTSIPTSPVRHPLPPKPAIGGVNIISSETPDSIVGMGHTDPRTVASTLPNVTPIIQGHILSSSIPFSSAMPTGYVQNFMVDNMSLGNHSSGCPPIPMDPSSFTFPNIGIQWPSSQSISTPAILESLADQHGVGDVNEKKMVSRKEKKRLASQARRRRKVEATSVVIESMPSEIASSTAIEMIKEPPQSIPTPPSLPPSEAGNHALLEANITVPLSNRGEGDNSAETYKASDRVQGAPPLTTFQSNVEPAIQDVDTSRKVFSNILPFMTDHSQSSISNSAVTAVTSTQTNITTTEKTVPKLEPAIETVSPNKTSAALFTIPLKRQISPSEELVVVKKRRDTSMGGDLEYPEVASWSRPEIAKEECNVADQSNYGRPTSPSVNNPLEKLPPQRESRSPSYTRQKSRSRPRPRSPLPSRSPQQPTLSPREPQADGAHTPPRDIEYWKVYRKPSISPRCHSRSPVRRLSGDHWSPESNRSNRRQHSSQHFHESYPSGRYIPRNSRFVSPPRSPLYDWRAPAAQQGRNLSDETTFRSTGHTNVSHHYSQSSHGNKEPSLRVWGELPKPYSALVEDNKSLVLSPPPERLSSYGRGTHSSHRHRDIIGRYPPNSEQKARTPPLPTPKSPKELSLVDRVFHDTRITNRTTVEARGTGHLGARNGRPKLQDRLSDGNQLKDRIS